MKRFTNIIDWFWSEKKKTVQCETNRGGSAGFRNLGLTRSVSHLSQTDPGVVEFFKLLLAVLQVLNEGVLDEKNTKNRRLSQSKQLMGCKLLCRQYFCCCWMFNARSMCEAQLSPCPPGQPCVPSDGAAASRWTR